MAVGETTFSLNQERLSKVVQVIIIFEYYLVKRRKNFDVRLVGLKDCSFG